jgi:hypothetical protein
MHRKEFKIIESMAGAESRGYGSSDKSMDIGPFNWLLTLQRIEKRKDII